MENLEINVKKEIKEEDVKELVNSDIKITEEKIENSLNYDSLSDEEKAAIEEFNKKIDVTDSTQVLQFGSKAQSKISQFSDSVLEGVKTKNIGEVGDVLSNLVGEIKSFDADINLDTKSNVFSKFFNNAKKQLNTLEAK